MLRQISRKFNITPRHSASFASVSASTPPNSCFVHTLPLDLREEYFRTLPKADLHIHLDGSIRLKTFIELAQQQNKDLTRPELHIPPVNGVPAEFWTEGFLREHLVKSHYNNLVEYLAPFSYFSGVMQTPEGLERVAYEFAEDSVEDGVYYVEARFAPQLHARDDMDLRGVLRAVNNGLAQAKAKINRERAKKPRFNDVQPPRFEYGIIPCILRSFDEKTSAWYREMCRLTPSSPLKQKTRAAAIALVYEMLGSRDIDGVPIAALDTAGAEDGFPASNFIDAYSLAHKRFFHSTVHAGEAYGPESIYQAVTDLYATRIGHGYHLFHPFAIQDPKIKDKDKYVNELIKFLGETRTALEVCLTSNLQTLPHLNNDLKLHAFQEMLDHHLKVVICTDNRLVSMTTSSRELRLASDYFHLTPERLKEIVFSGFEESFWLGSYKSKNEYLHEVERYYSEVENHYKKLNRIDLRRL